MIYVKFCPFLFYEDFHLRFFDKHPHFPVKCAGAVVALPDIEREVIAALRFRIGERIIKELCSDMLAATALVYAEVVDKERFEIVHIRRKGLALHLAENITAHGVIFVRRDEDGCFLVCENAAKFTDVR